MVDGSIVLNTRVDLTGFIKGLDDIERTIKDAAGILPPVSWRPDIDLSVAQVQRQKEELAKQLAETEKLVEAYSSQLGRKRKAPTLTTTQKEVRRVQYLAKKYKESMDYMAESTEVAAHRMSRTMHIVTNTIIGTLTGKIFDTIVGTFKSIATESYELFKGVNKASILFGEAEVATGRLEQKLLQLSAATGFTTTELTDGLYTALSSNIPATDSMSESLEFLSQVARTARGGFADFQETIELVAGVLNAYNFGVEETARVTGILTRTQDLGIITIGDMTESLGLVTQTASSLGINLEQVGASIATLTSRGINAASAITGLNQLFRDMSKSGLTGAKSLAQTGEYFNLVERTLPEFIESGYTINDILNLMAQYAEETGRGMNDLFRNVQSARTAIALAGGNSDYFNKALDSLYDTTGVVNRNAQKTINVYNQFAATLKGTGALIGGFFEPTVRDIVGGITKWLGNITNLRDFNIELDYSLEALLNTSKEYRDVQREIAGAVNDTNIATEAQARIAQAQALREWVSTSQDTFEAIRKNQKEIDKNTESIRENEDSIIGLDYILGQLGTNAKSMTEAYELYNKALKEGNSIYASNYEKWQGEINEWEKANEGLAQNIEEYWTKIGESALEAAALISKGTLSLQDFVSEGSEFYPILVRISTEYDKGVLAAQRYFDTNEINRDTISAMITEMREELSTLDVLDDRYASLSGTLSIFEEVARSLGIVVRTNTDEIASWQEIIDNMEESLRIAATSETLLGDAFDESTAQLSAYNTAFNKLLQDGSEEALLWASAIAVSIQNLSTKTEEAVDPLQELEEALEFARLKEEALGDAFDYNSAASNAYMDAIDALIGTLGSSHPVIQQLVTDMLALSTETEEQVDIWKDFKDEMFKANEADSYVEQLEAELEAIANQIDYLTDLDYIGHLNAIQQLEEEYTNLEGVLNRIRTSLDAYNFGMDITTEMISAMSAAMWEGDDAWAAFAKAGLNALGSLLDALAEYCVTQAAVALAEAFVNPSKWGAVALWSSGAIAAASAAGFVKGWAGQFATGGIVKGPYTGGDNLIAAVKAGETILNHSQAINTARLLDKAYGQGQSGGVINVVFNGDVYGDKDQIAEMVYRRTKMLQNEGRLGAW